MASMNNGEPTHVNRNTGRPGTPDVSLIHTSLLDKISWETVNELGSDHKPIIITYEDEMTKVNSKPRYKWKMSEADWEKYKKDIEDLIPNNYQRANINRLEKKLRKTIIKSANKNVGKKKVSYQAKPWMTTEIKHAIKVRNELRKTISQNRDEWIKACRDTSELITNRKNKSGKNMWNLSMLQAAHPKSGKL